MWLNYKVTKTGELTDYSRQSVSERNSPEGLALKNLSVLPSNKVAVHFFFFLQEPGGHAK